MLEEARCHRYIHRFVIGSEADPIGQSASRRLRFRPRVCRAPFKRLLTITRLSIHPNTPFRRRLRGHSLELGCHSLVRNGLQDVPAPNALRRRCAPGFCPELYRKTNLRQSLLGFFLSLHPQSDNDLDSASLPHPHHPLPPTPHPRGRSQPWPLPQQWPLWAPPAGTTMLTVAMPMR